MGPGRVRRGRDWVEGVDAAMTEAEVERVRAECVRRDRPFGSGAPDEDDRSKSGVRTQPSAARASAHRRIGYAEREGFPSRSTRDADVAWFDDQ